MAFNRLLPPTTPKKYFFYHLGKVLDSLLPKYDRFLLAGGFNCEDHEEEILNFSNSYQEKNIVVNKTCFKSVQNLSCMDLYLTNNPKSFQNTLSLPCGLSDHHNLVATVLK